MNVQLSENWEQFIRSQIESGRYASGDEVLDAAMRLLEQRDREQPEATGQAAEKAGESSHKPIWEKILENAASIPAEEWDKLPADGSEQHDHYIYGTPKRPTS